MPNWCENDLTIMGNPDTLADLADRLAADAAKHWPEQKNAVLTFQSYLPHDATVASGNTGTGPMGWNVDTQAWEQVRWLTTPEGDVIEDPEHLARLIDVDRHDFVTLGDGTVLRQVDARKRGIRSWYDWNVEHWGTKWDACHTYCDDSGVGLGTLVYRFDTAWSPPTPVILAMQAAHPDLRIEMHSREGGMGFQVWVHDDGTVHEDDYVWEPDEEEVEA